MFQKIKILFSLVFIQNAFANDTQLDSGDTTWMIVSSALVLLMTPGLGFFYGGMVRAKNVVSTLYQSFSSIAVVGLFWIIAGYSLVFSGDVGGFIGNLDWAFLYNVGMKPNTNLAPTIPHNVFMVFQMMFAIITPALITGAFAERINFKAWIPFMIFWSLFVYCPVAHWVWGENGWITKSGGIDFAGGLVVHMTSGYSALVAAYLFGQRKDFGENHKSYNMGMIVLGTALLWFGWFGFNAGSALAANGLAGHAFTTTFSSAASAFVTWMFFDWIKDGKPTAMGGCIGAIAGLVAITPGAGFVTIQASLVFGLITGIICNLSVRLFKEKLKVDDTLDVFACHGVGGTLGTILTGVFATTSINPDGANGLLYGEMAMFNANIIAAIVVAAYSMCVTYIILKIINFFIKVRVTEDQEEAGLDETHHGENVLALT